jgi:hypothetical protein
MKTNKMATTKKAKVKVIEVTAKQFASQNSILKRHSYFVERMFDKKDRKTSEEWIEIFIEKNLMEKKVIVSEK